MFVVAKLFEEVAAEYETDPTLAINYMIKNKQRNEAVHFNRILKDYDKLTTAEERHVGTFLSKYTDLGNDFLLSEIQSLNPLFCHVCEELSKQS